MKKLFSLIALAGVIAACTPEQVDTAFKLAGAKGTIDVEVVKLNGDPVEGQIEISGFNALPNASIAVSGNTAKISFQADESQSIDKTDLTLTASGENIYRPESAPIAVPDILAGQSAQLSCKIRVGESIGEWYVEEITEYGDAKLTRSYVLDNANSHYASHAYSHGGVNSWFVNNSEFLLTGNVKVPYLSGYSAGYDVVFHDYAGFEVVYLDYFLGLYMPTIVKDWVEDMSEASVIEKEVEDEFTVSAYSMWNYVVELYTTPIKASLVATKLDADYDLTEETIELATVSYDRYRTLYYPVEIPIPGAEAHYHAGHGHDAHGSMPNAGGGLSINE